ncbi:Sugar transporter, conserved site,Major facilitator superfamily domain,Major facilitator [Cinara cedri]|uniref:Sugar transporter, conserved site,Major facilitator superfamily domain,Major facilitator n=1 Tax=Cinara cedri TaxID=506608 RepID=A0A5E4NPT1_9HEMI|nr:Sugar transporter, conserved site,Major facilitator superfamily domain,Major facilitator [Cinara cedri]
MKETNKKNALFKYLEKIPQRWVVTIMGMMAVMMAFTMRTCLSITMTQMVMPVTIDSKKVHRVCPMPLENKTVNNTMHIEDTSNRFTWDEEIQGMILSAFYYGYIITHIPGGFLAQKFGGKFTLAYAILSTAVLTLLTPSVAHMGPIYLMIVRFIEGLGEGMLFPALCSLLAQWSPPHEKARLSALVFSGVPIGNICANLFSGIIIYYIPGGWPNVFYCYGTVSLIWLVLWLMVIYNNPHSHPFISPAECEYLYETIGSVERKKDQGPTPWSKILLAPAIWALVIAEVGFDWGSITISNDLPKYMNDVLHFSVKTNGYLTSTPYLAQWIMSMTSSVFADYMIKKKLLSVTYIRKIYAIIGTVGPGLGVMCASFVGCNKFMASFCFTIGMALMGFCYSSIRINALDLSPNYSASIMALVNGVGCLSGMISPFVVGLLTPNRTIDEWRVVFWIVLITLVLSSTIFTIFGSGELQPWDSDEMISDTKNKDSEKCKENTSVQREDKSS